MSVDRQGCGRLCDVGRATGVTLVIPAWNEPEAIGGVLDEVPIGAIDQVLVVVGSETDPTASVARAHGAQVVVQRAKGYGAACWTGPAVPGKILTLRASSRMSRRDMSRFRGTASRKA